MKLFGYAFLAISMALLTAACTPSQTACNTMEAIKLSFDEFAAEGEFSQRTILYVNEAYEEGERFCSTPGGYDQAEVIATATRVALLIRREMKKDGVAYSVINPQLDKLEGLLRQAQHQLK